MTWRFDARCPKPYGRQPESRIDVGLMDPSVRSARQTIDAAVRSLVFILKALPATSGTIDRITAPPLIETLAYPTLNGRSEADLYRPASPGPHPSVVVSLGVVPAGIDHPHRARFGEALARAGFVALLHWSPAMRDLRLDPEDIEDLASAYETLLARDYVDPNRSGFIGTCVGGSLALLAAARPRIRDRLAFVSAYAPYASMWTLARDVGSASRSIDGGREPWRVDPLVWQTYVRSVTAWLDPREWDLLRDAFLGRFAWNTSRTQVVESPIAALAGSRLSADGRSVHRILTATDPHTVELALRNLPSDVQASFDAMSPITCIGEVRAPVIVLLHDRHDHIIPVSELRQLWSMLRDRPGASYTELEFRHLDPTKLSPLRLARELPKLFFAIYPIYRTTA